MDNRIIAGIAAAVLVLFIVIVTVLTGGGGDSAGGLLDGLGAQRVLPSGAEFCEQGDENCFEFDTVIYEVNGEYFNHATRLAANIQELGYSYTEGAITEGFLADPAASIQSIQEDGQSQDRAAFNYINLINGGILGQYAFLYASNGEALYVRLVDQTTLNSDTRLEDANLPVSADDIEALRDAITNHDGGVLIVARSTNRVTQQ